MIFRHFFRRIPLFAGILVAFTAVSFSQDEESTGCWLDRFSLTAATSYHFRPWKEFNEEQHRWNDELRYLQSNIDPHGQIQTIEGDITFETGVFYQLFDDIHIRGVYNYTRAGASSDVRYASSSNEHYNLKHRTADIRLDVHSFGLGIDYTMRLGKSVLVQIYTVGTLNFGNLFSKRGYFDQASQGIEDYSNSLEETTMIDQCWGDNSGISFSYSLNQWLSLSLAGEYRYLVFQNFWGTAKETSRSSIYVRDASLIEINDNPDGILDLRSFGLKFGIILEL